MTPVNEPKNDTKLLLGIAGFVVAGAAAIVLLAGLNAERNDVEPTAQRTPAPIPARAEPIRILPAAYEPEPVEPTAPPVIAEPAAPVFRVDPEENFVARGLETFASRDYGHAEAYWAAEIEARPQRPWTHYMLALTLWKDGRLDEAAAAMDEAIKLGPDSIKSWINLARIQNDRGEFEAALDASTAALSIEPENPSARFLEGRSLMNLGRLDEAATALERSVTADPDNGYARNMLGLVRIRQGLADDAVATLGRAAELVPDVAYVHNNLGMALELSGRPQEALAAYRRAVEIVPDHAKAIANLERLGPTLPAEPGDETGEPPVAVADAAH